MSMEKMCPFVEFTSSSQNSFSENTSSLSQHQNHPYQHPNYRNPSTSANQNPTSQQNYGTLFPVNDPTSSQQSLEISPPESVFESRCYNMNHDYSYHFKDLESYFARIDLSTTSRLSRYSDAQPRALNRMRSDDLYSLAAGHPSYQNSSQNRTKYMEQYPYFSNVTNNNGGCGFDQSVRDLDYHDRFALRSFPSSSQNGTGCMAHPPFSNIGNNNGGRGYDHQNIEDRFALCCFPNFLNNNGSTSRRPRMRSQSYDALDEYGFSVTHNGGSQFRRVRSIDELESANSDTPKVSSLPNSPVFQSNYPSILDKLKGKVALAARSQSFYQVLQRILDERKPDLIEMIFLEVKDYVHDLMADQFGNHVIQKLLEVCCEAQMTQLILSFIHNQRRLLGLCFHAVGTRVMRKMIEHIKTPEQRFLLTSVLIKRTVTLSKNQNGYHVIQKCLEHFSFDYTKHLIKEIVESFLDIAMDKSGCCVLNRAMDCAQGELKERLLVKTTANAVLLSENPFGNYVVQHVLGKRIQYATIGILEQLKGYFAALAMNKYGSNVVEKCLIWCGEENAAIVIEEIMNSPYFVNICRNNFGNYVVQKALEVSKAGIHNALVVRINDFYRNLHGDINGKRLLKKARDSRHRI